MSALPLLLLTMHKHNRWRCSIMMAFRQLFFFCCMHMIPATIITGFLGAGKTTLLKRILTEAHGQKIAVIENEFGEEAVDNEILVTDATEQIIQMNNGCVCCTIREDLRSTLTDLANKRRSGALQFDRVVIETTGLADPGPVAQTFFMDDDVAEHYMLDSIITLVDAKHAHQQLDARLEAQRQVGFADQIFISKADLIASEELASLQRRLARMNPRAAQKVVNFGQVPLQEVLDLRGFNLNAQLELHPDFLAEEAAAQHQHHAGCNHQHAPGEPCNHGAAHDHTHGHKHDHGEHQCSGHGCTHEHHHHAGHHAHQDDVQSFVFRTDRPFDPAKLEDFLGAIVNIYGPRMYRYKGVLDMLGTDRKVIFQGVHQLMGSDLGAQWQPGEPRVSKMVFIGTELPKDILEQGLRQCQA